MISDSHPHSMTGVMTKWQKFPMSALLFYLEINFTHVHTEENTGNNSGKCCYCDDVDVFFML